MMCAALSCLSLMIPFSRMALVQNVHTASTCGAGITVRGHRHVWLSGIHGLGISAADVSGAFNTHDDD